MEPVLENWQCAGCAVEFTPSVNAPASCPICQDERQYIPGGTQRWTTRRQLEEADHRLEFTELEPGLTAICSPEVGIGQSALLVQTNEGNLLFDVPGLLTEDAVQRITRLGGIDAIVASHPHMYGVQSQYSERFDDAPIYIASADARWVQRRAAEYRPWDEPFEVLPGITLHQLGGHFQGSTVALWDAGAEGRGVLLAGDAVFPVADGNVTFLRSYPNRIPLSGAVVRRMGAYLSGLSFDRLYNNFAACVPESAQAIVQFSATRYAGWVEGLHDHLT